MDTQASGSILSLSFSPHSTRLVSSGLDNSIHLCTLLKTVDNAHNSNADNNIRSIAYSPNGELLASGSYDGTIKIWDARTLNLKFTIDDAHSSTVNGLSFSPTRPFLLSAGGKTVNTIEIALKVYNPQRFAVLLQREGELIQRERGPKIRKGSRRVLQCGLIGSGPKGVLGVILS